MSVLCFILDNKGYYTAATLVRNQYWIRKQNPRIVIVQITLCKELKWL